MRKQAQLFLVIFVALLWAGQAQCSDMHWWKVEKMKEFRSQLQSWNTVFLALQSKVSTSELAMEHQEGGFLQANYWALIGEDKAIVDRISRELKQAIPDIDEERNSSSRSNDRDAPDYGGASSLWYYLKTLNGQVEIDAGQPDLKQRQQGVDKIRNKLIPKCLEGIAKAIAELDSRIPREYLALDVKQRELCYMGMYKLDLNIVGIMEIASKGDAIEHQIYDNPFKWNRWKLKGDLFDSLQESVAGVKRYAEIVEKQGKRELAIEYVDFTEKNILKKVAYDAGYRTDSKGDSAFAMLTTEKGPHVRRMIAREMAELKKLIGDQRAMELENMVNGVVAPPECIPVNNDQTGKGGDVAEVKPASEILLLGSEVVEAAKNTDSFPVVSNQNGQANQYGQGGQNGQSGIGGQNNQYGQGGQNGQSGIGGQNNQYGQGGQNGQSGIGGQANQYGQGGQNGQSGIGGQNNQYGQGGQNGQTGMGGQSVQNGQYATFQELMDSLRNGQGGQNNQTGIGGQNNQTGIGGQNNQTGIGGQNNQTGIGGQNNQTDYNPWVTLEKGDSLSGIVARSLKEAGWPQSEISKALYNGGAVDAYSRANGYKDPNLLWAGQSVFVPEPPKWDEKAGSAQSAQWITAVGGTEKGDFPEGYNTANENLMLLEQGYAVQSANTMSVQQQNHSVVNSVPVSVQSNPIVVKEEEMNWIDKSADWFKSEDRWWRSNDSSQNGASGGW
jgi:hypothetical protein